MLELNDAIKNYENLSPYDDEYLQLSNWLKSLKEYIKKDTPMQVIKGNFCGNLICPNCNGIMALGVKNYCDICGQLLIK